MGRIPLNPLNEVDESRTTPAMIDIDNDGDLDAFIGEKYGTIKYYENTGSNTSAIFEEKTDSDNPFNGVDVGDNSAPVFVDIDNDGDMDAFIGEQDGTINYFENTDSNTSPVFEEQADSNNPFNGVDIGMYSTPSFVDIDEDGDMDAFIGEYDGTINYFENTETNEELTFTAKTDTDNPFNGVSVGKYASIVLEDLDNDGDMDAFIGDFYGNINYYENTGTNVAAEFTKVQSQVDVEFYSAPAFGDLNNDGDMDAFIGNYYGITYYYDNTGTIEELDFTEVTENDPFEEIDDGAYATPSLIDIDNDDDLDAIIGNSDGNIHLYLNIGDATSASFEEQTDTNNPFEDIDAGDNIKPTFVDIDNDGDYDLFIGNSEEETIHFYENIGDPFTAAFEEKTGTDNPFSTITVGSFLTPTFADINNDGDMDALIGEYAGSINYFENTGTKKYPIFTQQTDTNNPFNGIDIGYHSAPVFADIDKDGDMDVFIGEQDGVINYYKNTTNAPVITESQIFSISETASNDTSVGTVVATDADENTSFADWAITDGNDDGVFTINADTGEITVIDNTTLDYDTTSSYSLSIIVSDGSVISNVETVTINITESISTDINSTKELSIKCYPNPTTDYITIESTETGVLYIYNTSGALVKKDIVSSNVQQVSIGDLPAGLYIFNLITNSGKNTISVIKE